MLLEKQIGIIHNSSYIHNTYSLQEYINHNYSLINYSRLYKYTFISTLDKSKFSSYQH
jgi:hypothetical protein